ncbi:M16 family metallopeptidase [Rhizohabitans arisaemae]|uniref:M16 family metallopeptidase n=1 Tax=Rhizohabitans arisaemae TaxID=2720610 RepID=UPI0024B04E87|nr:pitrilysin family protein [Rhizohabitans arisaemae]
MSFPPRPVPGPPAVWSFPPAVRSELPGGLIGLTCHLPGRELASAQLVLDAGAGREPDGLAGTATIVARVLTEGTAQLNATEFANKLESMGATLSAVADLSSLRLVLDAPVRRLPAAVELLAEAAGSPALDEGEIARLRRERLDEIRLENADASHRARVALRAALYDSADRASLPTAGTVETVTGIDAAAVRSFYRDTFGTGTLVLAGDVTDAHTTLAKAFSGWQAAAEPSTPAEPRFTRGPRLVIVHRPDSVQTQLSIAHPAPGRDHGDWAALNIAAYVMGGGLNSRLNAVLREEKGYTYGFYAGMQSLRRHGLLIVEGAVHTEVTGPALADTIAEIRKLVTGGPTAEETASAVRALADAAPARFETAHRIVAELASAVAGGLPVEYPSSYLAALRVVDAQRAGAALAGQVDPDGLTVVAVGDADRIREPIEALGLADVEIVED